MSSIEKFMVDFNVGVRVDVGRRRWVGECRGGEDVSCISISIYFLFI